MSRTPGAVFVAIALIMAATPAGLQAAQTVPIHHAADIRLDPESRHLTVSDVITVNGRKEIRFRIAAWLTVKRMVLDGLPVPLPVAPGEWRTILPDQASHRIELQMEGTVPALRPARRGGTGQPAALAPEGGYLFDGAGWIPETGDDWVSFRLHVEVPAPYRAVATGLLAEEEVSGTAYRATFSANYPAPLPALFVGPYEIRERLHDTIRIRTYFHRDLADHAETYLRDSARYLTHFQKRIGPYPYRDFHVISAPIPVGLGFPNLTYIGRRIIPLPFIRARSLAHEVLHNWWGNGIAIDYRKGNWAEGLTTYMADYALAAEKDAKRGQQMRLGWLRDYAALPAERDVPVIRFTAKHDAAAQVIGYNKVAFVFHMLKRELGETTFTAALRLFWQRRQHRLASWMDLRLAFESASGRDLGWFFRQWLSQAGAPRLQLAQAQVEKRADGSGYRLRFTIRQDPPAYQLSIPVVIETTAGRRRERVVITGVETMASLETDTQPLALHIDPAHDLFRRLLPGEAPPILRDVTLATNVATLIAAQDLAMNGVALQLAKRMLDTPMRLLQAEEAVPETTPLLLIGATREIEAFLSRHGLAGIPGELAGRGTSRVWTVHRRNDQPLLVVAADTVQALQALLRPLPHYGSQSYLVFDGRRAIVKGTWPATRSPLTRRLN